MSTSKFRILVQILSLALLMAMLFGMGSSVVATPPSQEGGLFADAAVQGDGDLPDDPKIVRARFVEPDFEMLGGVGDTPAADVLELNLFNDVTFTAVLDRAESNRSGSLSWMGHLEGVEYGSVILVIKDGVMVGSIKMPGAFYQIRYVENGVHAIQEMNEAAFPPELEPIPAIVPGDALVEGPHLPTADDGSTIDVLVVYSDDARAAVGGTTAMENLIDQAIDETNTSYTNSGVAQQVNLVHAEEVAYDETGFNWSTTLSRLKEPSDGYIDNVHTLRDNYCADEVVFIIDDDAYCGLAYLMTSVSTTFEDRAFALVYWDCATGYYSFGHEMGHNMGARHDWYVDSDTTPYAYNHGYVNYSDPTNRWRTVMAYNTECSDQGFNCTRLQYWSNPSVTYNSDPMGVPAGTSTACVEGVPNPNCDADNQLLLDNTAYTVANFRDSGVCVPSTYSISGYVRNPAGVGINAVDVDFDGDRPAVTTNNSGYYTQSDFGDDNYIVSFSEPGYFFSPKEDVVTVSGANATHDATGYPIVPASFPFADDFESGDLGSAWAVETDYHGRVRVASPYPHWGDYSLLLDNSVNDGYYSFAAAILALDLSGETQVDLSFWWQDFEDEDHAEDGVFISDDYGATWYQALSFSGGPIYTYTQSVVDIDAAASSAGMSLNDHFLIKFQFYDNYQIDSDGYGIDDVVVNDSTVVGPVGYGDYVADDDNSGDSSGDDDGIVDCGESIEMWVDLYNQGGAAATGVTATISTSDPYITITANTLSSYPNMAGWEVATNDDDFEFDVAPETPFIHDAQFDLNIVSTSGGPWSDSFDVTVRCGFANVYLPIVVKHYPPIPATPVLNAIDNADGDGNYTVSWNAATGADTYTLQEDDNSSFSSPVTAYSGAGTSTAISGKSTGTYYYRVRASNAWGNSGWSNTRGVTVQPPVSGPTPGFWASAYEEFYVTADRAYVDDFATYVYIDGCGNYKITHTTPEPISSNQFSFTGSFYANGTFSDATHCSGQNGLDNFYIAGCGYITGGPWSYNATWQSSALRITQRLHVAERVSTAAAGTSDAAFQVEKIGD